MSEGESEERRRDEWRRGRGGVTRRAECRIKIIKGKKKNPKTHRERLLEVNCCANIYVNVPGMKLKHQNEQCRPPHLTGPSLSSERAGRSSVGSGGDLPREHVCAFSSLRPQFPRSEVGGK